MPVSPPARPSIRLPSTCPSVSTPVHRTTRLSDRRPSTCPVILPSIHLSLRLPIFASIRPSTRTLVHTSVHTTAHPSNLPSLNTPSLHHTFFPLILPFNFSPAPPSFRPFVRQSTRPSVHRSFVHKSTRPYDRLSHRPPVRLSPLRPTSRTNAHSVRPTARLPTLLPILPIENPAPLPFPRTPFRLTERAPPPRPYDSPPVRRYILLSVHSPFHPNTIPSHPTSVPQVLRASNGLHIHPLPTFVRPNVCGMY